MAAGRFAGAAVGVALRRGERLAWVAIPLADAAGAFLAEAELRQLDRRQRDADEVLAFPPDHFTAADVLAKVRLRLATYDLAEALVITFDFLAHGVCLISLGL